MIVISPSKPRLRRANAAASPVPPPPTMTTRLTATARPPETNPTSDDTSDRMHPAVRIRSRPALDVDQRLAKSHRDLTWLAIADRPRAMRRLHAANRRDHRCRAAGEDLGQGPVGAAVAPFVGADP